MVIEYSPETVPLKPAKLGNPEFRAIGRIVRACAEIEDIVTLFIAKVLGIQEGSVAVMLGQTPYSKKLSIAQYLAKIQGGEAIRRYNEVFTEEFSRITTCRNAVAHGVMLGKSADGRWAFLTAKREEPVIGSAVQIVISYTTSDLQLHAKGAEWAVSVMESVLAVQELRSKRHGRPLLPHRKGLAKKRQGGSRPQPAGPSRP